MRRNWRRSNLRGISNDVARKFKPLTDFAHSYGSLYYANEKIDGVVPTIVTSDVPTEVQKDVRDRFVIGPVAERSFWEKERLIEDHVSDLERLLKVQSLI